MAGDAHERTLEGQLEETRRMMLAMSHQLASLSSQVAEITSLKQQVEELEAMGSGTSCPADSAADRAPKRARPGGGGSEVSTYPRPTDQFSQQKPAQ